jgi:nickel-dependent lactate racemase
MELQYGKGSVHIDFPEKNVRDVLQLKHTDCRPLHELLTESVTHPCGASRLSKLLRSNKPTDVVILVSDRTRSIAHYSEILTFLVGEIVDAGVDEKNIEFVVALGTHRAHTHEENSALYGALVSDFRFSNHDCHQHCVSIGTTSTGLDVQVNKRVRDADFVIATGKIDFHYMAGFSGGRKAVLPGIASYATIRNNHCKLRRAGVAFGALQKNIIAEEMAEAARLFGLGYVLNVVETSDNRTAHVYCGAPECAFAEGVAYFTTQRSVAVTEKVDCVIVSAGGYPHDKTLYASHKSLNSVVRAVDKGGAVVLVAQCCEGVGNEAFMRNMRENSCDTLLTCNENTIEIGGHRAFVTAQLLTDYKVYVLSDLDPDILEQMHFIPIRSVDECIKHLQREHGEHFRTYVVPEGRSILPVINGKQSTGT